MKPIESTAEILAFKMMGYPIDKRWVNWAYDMLCAGFDTENLVQLAGEIEPYNQFELEAFTDKALKELELAWDNREQVLKNYTCYLVGKVINGEENIFYILSVLTDIYTDLDMERSLREFALLFWAYQDLQYSKEQYYWIGATRENIDEVMMGYFRKWRAECERL